MIQIEKTKIIRKNGKERLIVEACGHDGIRVRATQNGKMDDSLPTGIDDIPKLNQNNIKIYQENKDYVIENGKIKCIIQQTGRLKFYNNNGDLLLEEYERNRFRELFEGDFYSALEIVPRTFQPISNTPNYHITVRFEAHDDEKFFGMGQYQQPLLNLKGCRLELAQRNSQVSIPFERIS